MVLTDEMMKILEYLNYKEDYAIFAGFAAYVHTTIESSADIDILVKSIKEVNTISKYFACNGWKKIKTKTDNSSWMISTLDKNNTTFDIIFSKSAEKIILPKKVKLSFKGKQLYFISKEALFLSKLIWLASENRTEEKIKRDRKVVNILRKDLNLNNLRKLMAEMEDPFWTNGYL